MDAATYAVLLFGALAGGFVSGLAGFGTALMALGIWLYVLSPALAVPLVLICSVSSQLSTLPSMWRLMDFRLALPFVLGGLAGMPIGALLVARADPQVFKMSVGVMLIVFPTALYFARAPMKISFGGRTADAIVGFAGGILGGLAGLSGPLPTLWASVRGWTKDQRRGVFQLFNGTVLGAALDLSGVSDRLIVSRFDGRERNVGEALQVEPQNTKVDRLLDQLGSFVSEILLVAHKREDHADGECIAEREPRSQIDRDDVFKAKDRVVEGGEHDFRPAQADVRAHHLAVAVEPLAFALTLTVEELEALDGSHALDKGGTLLGLSLDRRFGALPENTVKSEPYASIKHRRGEHDEG